MMNLSKSITSAILTLLLVFNISLSVIAASYSLPYWSAVHYDADDEGCQNTIGYWSSYPTVATVNLNSNSYHYSSVGDAISKWNSALNTSFSYTITGNITTSNNIHIYGGTLTQLTSLNLVSSSDFDGLAGYTKVYSDYVEQCTCTASTRIFSSINVRKIYKAQCFVIYDGQSSSSYRNVCIHELGHAFGWFGHSNQSSDVMYYSNTTTTTLSSKDKQHLKQIYDNK